jgi:hypothetical protein
MTDWPICENCKKAEVTELPEYMELGLCYACGKQHDKEEAEVKAEEKKVAYTAREKVVEEVRKEEVKKKAPQIRKDLAREEYRYIPRYMRWCALNPTLTICEEDMTRRDVRLEKAYIKLEGEAGPLAANQYALIKGNEKALIDFFNNIKQLAGAHAKKRESREKTEDAKQIVNIMKLLKDNIQPKGNVEVARAQGRLPARRVNKK